MIKSFGVMNAVARTFILSLLQAFTRTEGNFSICAGDVDKTEFASLCASAWLGAEIFLIIGHRVVPVFAFERHVVQTLAPIPPCIPRVRMCAPEINWKLSPGSSDDRGRMKIYFCRTNPRASRLLAQLSTAPASMDTSVSPR